MTYARSDYPVSYGNNQSDNVFSQFEWNCVGIGFIWVSIDPFVCQLPNCHVIGIIFKIHKKSRFVNFIILIDGWNQIALEKFVFDLLSVATLDRLLLPVSAALHEGLRRCGLLMW